MFFSLSRTHVSMVTSEHMNQLLKNVLNLIKKNIGNENAPWMTRIAGKPVKYCVIC
jgi:ryanodine receptor 2